MTISLHSRIIIVGSGVFGLTSALHLAKAGYTDISIYDRLDLLELGYTFENGADTASADINKVFRAFYEDKEYYHKLALQAKAHFLEWDNELRNLDPNSLDAKAYKELKILTPSGLVRLYDTPEIPQDEKDSLKSFENSGLRDTQFIINDPIDSERASKLGWSEKLNPADIKNNPYFEHFSGVLDSTSGLLHASSACIYVNKKLRSLGVKFYTGEEGEVTSFIEKEENGKTKIEGVVTKDGKLHKSELTVVAAGPWTASLVPELAGLSEAQNGNVIIVKVPENRTDLLSKYSTDSFPIFIWKQGPARERDRFSGFGAFPIGGSDGYFKFICRQKKLSNPVKIGEKVISVPITSNSTPSELRLSKELILQVKDFIKVFFPDLVDLGIHKTALLWYTDTINNDFIIDRPPRKDNLLVVTGGSGHGFKFLPVLGQFAVDVIEGRSNTYTKIFSWRDPEEYEDINQIGGIKFGKNDYNKEVLSESDDLVFTAKDKSDPVVL